jgi:lyso-ornithine lipid O-acyltransferase
MRVRAVAILTGLALFTLPLMPVQAVLLRANTKWARRFPHWYHRNVCRALGIDLEITGAVVRDAPVLLVANHVSWLDIPVISAVAPVSFVAKKEVASWPFVSILANLQRTVFVDRERRTKIGDTANEITSRLASGDAIVLFAEGTSSDGNRILPFKTSLFAAAKPTASASVPAPASSALVQTLTVVYTRRHGIPMGWVGRRNFGYYGDVDMGANAWSVLTSGPIHARIIVSDPVPLENFKDRKALAQWAEKAVRDGFVATLRG